jgi:GAF domain-containing protein
VRDASSDAPSEARVAADVLGLSYEDLGLGVAQSWGLPDSLRRVMSPPQEEVPTRSVDSPIERMRWRVRAAGEMVQLLLDGDPAHTDQRVLKLGERYARALGLRAEEFGEALGVARVHLSEMAASLKIKVAARTRARRLMSTITPATALEVEAAGAAPAPGGGADDATLVLPAAQTPEQAIGRLSAGIAQVTDSLAGDHFKLNEVLRLILGTILQGLAFDRVVFCLRDPKTGLLSGRIGLGSGSEALVPRFVVDARGPQAGDLFAAACLKGVDTLITDGRSASLAPRLPVWYRPAPALSFLLLPLILKNAPFALIYADRQVSPIDFGEQELSLLRTLRNQAVMAFKAAG